MRQLVVIVSALIALVQGIQLFSMSCDDQPDQLSDWSSCIWPHGNLADAMRQVINDARTLDCKLPPARILKQAQKFLRNNTEYLEHPLYRRSPSTNCGNCGRRVRCCRKARSFLTQSFTSELCANYSQPCVTDPLSDSDLAALQAMYPEAIAPIDGCDVTVYVKEEMKTLQAGKAFEYVEPLMCQVLGTKAPTVNCARVGDKCQCCCSGFRAVEGVCQPDPTHDNACS